MQRVHDRFEEARFFMAITTQSSMGGEFTHVAVPTGYDETGSLLLFDRKTDEEVTRSVAFTDRYNIEKYATGDHFSRTVPSFSQRWAYTRFQTNILALIPR